MKKEFFSCYQEVFNKDGTVKCCGREKVIQLIEAAEKLCPDAKHGEFGSKKQVLCKLIN